MPEGPEIRRAADKLEAKLAGQVIEHIEVGLASLAPHAELLTGQLITHLETRGKALLTHFAHGFTVYSHNQLYGVWKLAKRGKYPSTRRQLRLGLHTATHSALLYSASDISVWATRELHQHPFLAKLGPDILNADLHWRDIAKRLNQPAFRRRALSSLYLDQGFLAGVGNYLRSEILFDAGLPGTFKPVQLTQKQRNQLARSTLAVTQRSYQTGGYTVPSALLPGLKVNKAPYESIRFMVFGRDDLPCRRCGHGINKQELGGRRFYQCDNCQPRLD